MPLTTDNTPMPDRPFEDGSANPGEKRDLQLSPDLRAALEAVDALSPEERKALLRKLAE